MEAANSVAQEKKISPFLLLNVEYSDLMLITYQSFVLFPPFYGKG